MNELQVIEKALQGIETQEARIVFPIDKVKAEAGKILEKYKHAIYTDEMVKTCKEDRKNLNAIINTMESTRKSTISTLTAPLDVFNKDMKDTVAIIIEAVEIVKVKEAEFEAKRKKELEEKIGFAVARVKEQSGLEQKYLDKIEIKKNFFNVNMTINKITKDLESQVVVLKAEFDALNVKIDTVKMFIDIMNETHDLQVPIAYENFEHLIELDVTQLKDEVTKLAVNRSKQEKDLVEKLQREAKEEADRKIAAETKRLEKEKQDEIDKIEADKQAEIKKQVAAQTKEVVEKAEETIKVNEVIAKEMDKFMPSEALPTEKLFERTIKVKATKNQLISLREFMNASGIEVL